MSRCDMHGWEKTQIGKHSPLCPECLYDRGNHVIVGTKEYPPNTGTAALEVACRIVRANSSMRVILMEAAAASGFPYALKIARQWQEER